MASHCCARCRLLQDEAERCVSCGEAAVYALTVKQHFLVPKNEVGAVDRHDVWRAASALAMVGVAVIGGYLAEASSPASWLWVIAGMAGALYLPLLGRKFARWTDRIRPARAPKGLLTAGGAAVIEGTAKKLVGSAVSFVDGAECLAVSAIARDGRGTLLRAARAVEFLVAPDGADGEVVVVAGEVWLNGEGIDVELGGFDIPRRYTLSHPFRCVVLMPGDRVRVYGQTTTEQRPQLARGYRDAGSVTVVRGVAGAPAIVELL